MKRRPLLRGAMPLFVFAATLAPAVAADAPPDDATRQAAFQNLALSISPTLPGDISGGAGNATLTDAATFAWQEFIALNWPALQQNGQVVRDQPDGQAVFGSPGAGPLVWETYRHKVEIFPGSNSPSDPPHGYNNGSGNDPYGYNSPPVYVYSPAIFPNGGQVNACSGQPAAQAPWINLDETSEIGLTNMFAGVLNNVAPSASNSAPQQFRYLAKANSTEYNYIAGRSFWYSGANTPLQTSIDTWTTHLAAGTPPDPGSVVTLPAGTIEVKSAWRMLAPNEDASRFHTNTVRYYETGPGGVPCYWQAEWALAALHIIQKTPSAPYFIFATFEQADNIVQPDGSPIENAAGAIVQQPVGSTPTTPGLTYQDSPSNPVVQTDSNAYCNNTGSRLFFHEIAAPGNFQGTPVNGNICVNKRFEPIPSEIQQVNTMAQTKIQNYSASNGISSTPWTNYKLVSVQTVPFNKSDIVNSFNSPRQASNYYQANIVVETDYTLQQFSGRIAADNAPTDYPDGGSQPNFQNVYLPAGNNFNTYQMGGCMGCHGNAQVGGTDFSFLIGGNTLSAKPDAPDPTDAFDARAFYRARLTGLPSLPSHGTTMK